MRDEKMAHANGRIRYIQGWHNIPFICNADLEINQPGYVLVANESLNH
jgi:hypothetical protein